MVSPLFELFHRARRRLHAGYRDARNDSRIAKATRRFRRGGFDAGTDTVFLLVLGGYFLVHFFEHTLAPHFHFGEETHHHEMSHSHASSAALLGLGIHTFFDGVAIASGLLVPTWLGGVIFIAIFLHKLPEGFTVASLMLASGRGRKAAFLSAVILGATTLLGMIFMFAVRGTSATPCPSPPASRYTSRHPT